VLTQYLLKLHPALVVTSSVQNPATEDQKTDSAAEQKIGAGMATYWRQLLAAGIKVASIQSTPHLTLAAFSCVSRYSTDYAEKCTQARSQAVLTGTPLAYAVAAMGDQVPLIDMTQYFCTASMCPVVIGNVVVYFDNKHLTRSYAQTLAPYLEVKLRATFPALLPSPSSGAVRCRDWMRPVTTTQVPAAGNSSLPVAKSGASADQAGPWGRRPCGCH
jgi:hypothetical protein